MALLSIGVGWPYLGLRKKGRGVNDPFPVIKEGGFFFRMNEQADKY